MGSPAPGLSFRADRRARLAGQTAPMGFFDPLGLAEDADAGRVRFYREVRSRRCSTGGDRATA